MSKYLQQAAVIPVLDDQIVMITSQSGARWVIPKGMIDPGFSAAQAALLEAWEEAGLQGVLHPDPFGSYHYSKNQQDYLVTTFVMRVTTLAMNWPEKRLRKREILAPQEAILRIREPGLRLMITQLFALQTSSVNKELECLS